MIAYAPLHKMTLSAEIVSFGKNAQTVPTMAIMDDASKRVQSTILSEGVISFPKIFR